MLMPPPVSAQTACCAVVELRQYTLKPGQRDALIEVFDRHFVEGQESQGMTIAGQFRDRQRPDRFVWLRGFPDMAQRHQALDAFYGAPIWTAHKAAANATMVDVGDVLLLKPAAADRGFRLAPPAAASREGGAAIVLAGIHQIEDLVDAEAVSRFDAQVAPVLRSSGVAVEGVFVTEPAPNTFTRLPVREGEHVLVWFGTADASRASEAWLGDLSRAAALDRRPAQVLALEPTPRSLLGGGPKAARASRHDFDFLFGSWKIHNRYLKARLQGAEEWVDFEADTEAQPLLDGLGNLDRMRFVRNGQPIEGVTLRLFNPTTGEWMIHWADTVRPGVLQPPMVGRFAGDTGVFFGEEEVGGRKVLCRFLWTRAGAGAPRWEQAFSADGGTTWETNWIMTFTRRP